MENHFYNADGFYVRSGQAGKGLCPRNSTRVPLPPVPDDCGEWALSAAKQWPRWNGTAWELVEDHRRRVNEKGQPIAGTGTAYWLPDDGWQAPARYRASPGPLPENALLQAPEKSLEMARQETMVKIRSGYNSALAAALTMPREPDIINVAVETAALLAVDEDAVETLRVVLDTHRSLLEHAVNTAETLYDVENISIDFPV